MISLKEISYSYKDKEVFKSLTLDIPGNAITSILGGSGCGKTTLLRIIAGLEIPAKGDVIIDGAKVTSGGKLIVPPHKRNLGFVFQDLALWPHMSVYENVAFGLKVKKEKDIAAKVKEILAFFGIEDRMNKYPHQLSGGQKQLVAIARAVIVKPRILLLDEPLANLDVKLKHKITGFIKKLKMDFSLTIVYVTHDHKEALTTGDFIVVMNEGKIEATGTPAAIKNSANPFVRYFLEDV